MSRLLHLGLMVLIVGSVVFAQQISTPSAPSQAPAVTFKSEINYVEINASVTDENGNFVKNLIKDEFEIYEDGIRQNPAVFSLVDLPAQRSVLPLTGSPPVESDVRATTRNFDGRLYVLVLDDLHTTTVRTSAVREVARRFIEESLGPNDLVSVVHTSGREDAAQELTDSRLSLLAAIDKFQGSKLPSASAERLAAFTRERNQRNEEPQRPGERRRIDDPLDAERAFNARRSLALVRNVADWMADIRGRRKALVLFSEGVDYDITDIFNNRSATDLTNEARDAIAAAQRANVSIYAIDPRGLGAVSAEAIEVAETPANPALGFATPSSFEREAFLGQQTLRNLAEETGGLAVVNTNDLAGGVARIVSDNNTYYVLGYYSDLSRSRNGFRPIEVRVKRPSVQVRARRGYVPSDAKDSPAARDGALAKGTSPALDAALNNPLPIGDLPMRVFAAPFKGTGRNASVFMAIEIESPSLKFEEKDGRFHETVEVAIMAADRSGKVQGGDRQSFALRLRPETHQIVSRAGGVRIVSRFEVPAGRYHIRVGAHESVGGMVGTVPYDLEVPDYARTPFALSGLVVTSTEAGRLMTSKPDPVLKDVFPVPPVATRVFDPAAVLGVFTELYDNSTAASHVVDFVATVRNATDGKVIHSLREDRPIEAASRGRTQGYKAEVPLKNLGPGLYVLRVEASSRETNHFASREIPFEIAGAEMPRNSY